MPLLILLCTAQLIVILDISAVNVALPDLATDRADVLDHPRDGLALVVERVEAFRRRAVDRQPLHGRRHQAARVGSEVEHALVVDEPRDVTRPGEREICRAGTEREEAEDPAGDRSDQPPT